MEATTILLVEDDDDVRAITEVVLASSGYEVVTAINGRDALKQLAALDPDMLVTDIVMPEMNGFELAERARALKPQIRILCITGYSWAARGTRQYCDAVIQKPWTTRQLKEAVSRVLRTEAKKPGCTDG
jgi:CheY-like chemotaxis protein